MKKLFSKFGLFLFKILIFCSILALGIRFGATPALKMLGFEAKAGLKVLAMPDATVYINGAEVGKTPYQNDNLAVGEYKVQLVSGQALWQGVVSLNSGTVSVVNRELAPSLASSSGEIFTLYPGKGVSISSVPTQAEVEIDGKFYGKTPLVVPDVAVDKHAFLLSYPGYLKRSIRASVPSKMRLDLAVDLASSEAIISVSPQVVEPSVAVPKMVLVSSTPTGFLRVRNKPSLQGLEIDRVSSGDRLTLIEEVSGWYKVKLDGGQEGYISSIYSRPIGYPPR